MAIISENIWNDILLALIILAVSVYFYLTSNFDYWQKRGVPYARPLPIFGSMKDILLSRKHIVDVFSDLYYELDGHKFGGVFEMRKPSLLVRDPELIHRILVTDFSHFYDRLGGSDPEKDPLSANLANLQGEAWRQLRYRLTPVFTSGRLKGMFEQISQCGGKLLDYIDEQSKIEKTIDGKKLISTFTLEIIGTCAFGIQMDKENEMTKAFFEVTKEFFVPSKLQNLRVALLFMFPRFARKLGIKTVPESVEKVTMQIIKEVLHHRKANRSERNDFIQLLLNLQKAEQNGSLKSVTEVEHDPTDDVINQMEHASVGKFEESINQSDKPVFTDAFVAAQIFVFLIAGAETVSTPTCYTLFALTQHPQILKRVTDEIDTVLKNHGYKWSYQAVKEMVYLDQVIQESLRKYTIAVNIVRLCTRPYKIPGTNVVVEEGMRIFIPLDAIHNDPKYYPSPETFDPDRFIGNNFKPSGIFMPFGHGPRICIAMRFAVLEMKVALARILSQYSVRLSSRTKVPLKYSPNSRIRLPDGGLWFEFDKRQ